ncbi:MAG TPA: hypothetical protein VFO60_10040 [Candidatus Dormibacteraeota bacterium]|nr:hypothetical protein [Candidatus Dormibacteraeota bacterium]
MNAGRRRAASAALAAAAAVAAALPAAMTPAAALAAAPAAASATPTPDPHAGEPWWIPLGLRGTDLTRVVESGGRVTVVTASGATLVSADGGTTFAPAGTSASLPARSASGAGVRSGDDEWRVDAGTVLHSTHGGVLAPDPGSPDLGSGAHLVAAPVATPGVVVAVSDRGVVWRRTAAGAWNPALLLLPRSIIGGIPSITDLVAFTGATPDRGLSATVYLATDGYSVLATSDGGDDWFRDDPGLPDSVRSLAAAPDLGAVLAATDDGLWVHHLRVPPSVPRYPAPDLRVRQLWIGGITAGAGAAAPVALWLALRAGRRRRPDGRAEGP